jgi:prolyl 4-hydroxylase
VPTRGVFRENGAMTIVINVAPELRDWIQKNLVRGCAPERLIEGMLEQRFAPDIARGLVDVFARALSRGEPVPDNPLALDVGCSTYVYEPSRLASGNRITVGGHEVGVVMRLEQPTIAVLEGVLSATECAQLIELARPRLRPSTVAGPRLREDVTANHRTSEGTFFALCETPFIATIDRRISELMGCPLEHGEPLQVLRYGPGTRAEPHFDFLVASNGDNDASLARSGQRISSLVIYLCDVLAGGETAFPEAGLSVSPRQGNAVYFEYGNSLGQVDHRSLHAGMPVLEGEKWALTKWMRSRRFVMAD